MGAKKPINISEIAKEAEGLEYTLPPMPSEEEVSIYNQYVYRDAHKYILEVSTDGINWKPKAVFEEGQMSRFGKLFSPEVAILEAKAFKDYWKPQNRSYDQSVLGEIKQNTHVRIIIEV